MRGSMDRFIDTIEWIAAGIVASLPPTSSSRCATQHVNYASISSISAHAALEFDLLRASLPQLSRRTHHVIWSAGQCRSEVPAIIDVFASTGGCCSS